MTMTEWERMEKAIVSPIGKVHIWKSSYGFVIDTLCGTGGPPGVWAVIDFNQPEITCKKCLRIRSGKR